MGLLPGVGTAQSLLELISGRDYIAGEKTSRWMAAAGLFAGLVPGGKGLLKALSKADDVADLVKAGRGVTSRPSGFRKQTVQDAWDNAAPGSTPGTRACPTCGTDAKVAPGQGRRDWDVDHQPKWKDRDLTDKTRKEVLDEYNKDVRLRCPGCNRSDNQ